MSVKIGSTPRKKKKYEKSLSEKSFFSFEQIYFAYVHNLENFVT